MATLVKNTTRQVLNLPGGFSIKPGEQITIPLHVLAHPYTESRIRTGRLEIVVEAKATKPARRAVKVEDAVEEPEAE